MEPAIRNQHQIMGQEIVPAEGTWQAEAYANGRKFYGAVDTESNLPTTERPNALEAAIGQTAIVPEASSGQAA